MKFNLTPVLRVLGLCVNGHLMSSYPIQIINPMDQSP